jgi:hypothetical protein
MRYSNKGANGGKIRCVCQYGCPMDRHSMLLGLYNRLCRGSLDQRESLDRKNYGYRFYCPGITVCNCFEIIAIRFYEYCDNDEMMRKSMDMPSSSSDNMMISINSSFTLRLRLNHYGSADEVTLFIIRSWYSEKLFSRFSGTTL